MEGCFISCCIPVTRWRVDIVNTFAICVAAPCSRPVARSMSARRSSTYDAMLIAASAARSSADVISGILTASERRFWKGMRDTAYNDRVSYRWVMLLLAAAAMVGTLPGRTQGLGLVTEPLIADLGIGRVDYAQLNLWATLIGAVFAIGIGRFIDRLGARIVLTTVAAALGIVVCAMSNVHSFWALAIAVTLTRGFGQSALSVISLTMVGQWFVRGIDGAMAVYSILMSIGFMIAFPVVGSLVQSWGWRSAWFAIGIALLVVLAPLSLALART